MGIKQTLSLGLLVWKEAREQLHSHSTTLGHSDIAQNSNTTTDNATGSFKPKLELAGPPR